jgi:uncharacterized protein (DUF2147 family)
MNPRCRTVFLSWILLSAIGLTAGARSRAAEASAAAPTAGSPVGLWKTIDDKTGQPRGLVRIYADQGVLFAKVEGSLGPGPHLKICAACRDERKDQPMLGLLIMRNMKFKDGSYEGGDILDPDNGNVYRCKLTLDAGGQALTVRGYIGTPLLGRSQRWLRAD